MSAKLIYSLTDETTNGHKQIGCMNGFLHLFDRNHFHGGRRISSQNHKRLTPGQSANNETKSSSATQKATESNPNELAHVKEKQRVSVESSRTSCSSSSCTSTFSSADYNKPSSTRQSICPELPSHVPPRKYQNSSLHSGHHAVKLRDVVKDSMYKEAHGLSVKTTAREDRTGRVIKHVDSPRPMQQPNQASTELQTAPWISKERVGNYLPLAPKDSPRLSYDERESRDKLKSTLNLREFPRLSLDSRENSIRNSVSESRSSWVLEKRNKNYGQTQNLQQEPGSNKRPSNVVAKLMGLETLPDSILNNNNHIARLRSWSNEDSDTVSRSPTMAGDSRSHQVTVSPTINRVPRNANSTMKPIVSSRLPLEPAPWRQSASSHNSKKPASKCRDAPMKASSESASVYGEIQKRLAQIEFTKSGKDLRALKQILEAIEKTRERLEGKNEGQTPNLEPGIGKDKSDYSSFNEDSKPETPKSQQGSYPAASPTFKGARPFERIEMPISIIKSARSIEKTRSSLVIPFDGAGGIRKLQSGHYADNRKHLVDQNASKDPVKYNRPTEAFSQPLPIARASKTAPISKAPQQMTGENPTTSFKKSSSSVSPRFQHKKDGMEEQSCPTTMSNDSSRFRRQSNMQPIESGSPRRRMKSKSTTLQKHLKQASETSNETRDLSHENDTISTQSESNISSASQIDTDVTSRDHYDEIHCRQPQRVPKHINPETAANEDQRKADLAILTLEHPSPVSVLDATFYREGSPSPVEKMSNAFRDEETINTDEAGWNSMDLGPLPNSSRHNLSYEFNHKKIENIEFLANKLRSLNYTHDEATRNQIAFYVERANPEQRYIIEILLASGVLGDIDSSSIFIQQHLTGHIIKPNLFQVLELTKERIEPANEKHNQKITLAQLNDKIQRKLVFDTVNEILIQKLVPAASVGLWVSPTKQAGKSLNGQKLVKELFSEMKILQAYSDCVDEEDGLTSILKADMMHPSANWAFLSAELPALVLDIERLIFKDLITEITSSEMACLQGQPQRHLRQLFPK